MSQEITQAAATGEPVTQPVGAPQAQPTQAVQAELTAPQEEQGRLPSAHQTAGYSAAPESLIPAAAPSQTAQAPEQPPQAQQAALAAVSDVPVTGDKSGADVSQPTHKQAAQAEAYAKSAQELGYSDIQDTPDISSAMRLAVELGVPRSLLEAAWTDGQLDVSKLGNLAPRDAAVLKSSVETAVAQRQAAEAKKAEHYKSLVGGQAYYDAMTSWVTEAAANDPDLKSFVKDAVSLMKQGGTAADLVVKEMYRKFQAATGTSINARVGKALAGYKDGTPLDKRKALDQAWDMLNNKYSK